jgi:thymidylate kinase
MQSKPEHRAAVPGLWIALYGPDGAGKSAVVSRIAAELAPLFSGVQLHHLRIDLGRNAKPAVPVTDPHAQLSRGLMLSCLKLLYMFLHSWLVHVLRTLFWIGSGGLLIFDRYYLDYAIDPQRYRLSATSVRLASLLGRLAPQPDLQFVLDVRGEELQRRKPEVSLAESRRQRNEYAARIGSLPNAVLVDADRAVAEVASEIAGLVLHYARRASPPAAEAVPSRYAREQLR